MPTQGNPRGPALSGDRLPCLLKHHPGKVFLSQPTQPKSPSQAWLLSKTAVGWAGEKASSDRRVCFRCLTRHFAPFMPGNKCLNKSWGSWIWQWSFSQKPWACLLVEVKNVIRARGCKLHWFRAVALRVVTVFMREWIIPLPRRHKCSKRSSLSEKPFFINPLPTTFHSGVWLQIYTLFIIFFLNILAC